MIEALFLKSACLLFVGAGQITRCHTSHRRRGVESAKSSGTELFIDAPSNKLFSGQRASRNSDDGVVLPYKRADDFYETKCRGIVRFGCVSDDDDASTVVTTTARRKIPSRK